MHGVDDFRILKRYFRQVDYTNKNYRDHLGAEAQRGQ
jgi:hypothetical protein